MAETSTSRLRWILLAAAVIGLPNTSPAQRASNWRVYKLADGLPESACMAITISPHGKVLVRHVDYSSLTELDGYGAFSIPAPDTGKGRVYQSPGGQLWAVIPGGLQEYSEGTWRFHRVAELAGVRTSGPNAIDPVPLCPVRQGLVFFLLPNGLWQFNASNPDLPGTTLLHAASQSSLEQFTTMTMAHDGGLWIAGVRGLAKVPGPLRSVGSESEWVEFPVPPSLQIGNLQVLHEAELDDATNITMLATSRTSSQKLVTDFNGQHWDVTFPSPENLRHAWRSPDQTRWAMKPDGLLQAGEDGSGFVENEEISARQYYDVALESSGNFWLATSDGVFRYAPVLWRTPVPCRNLVSPVRCLAADPEGQLWFAAAGKLYSLHNRRLQEHAFGNSNLQPRAFFLLKNGTFVAAAEEPGADRADELFKWQPGRSMFAPVPVAEPGRRLRVLGMFNDGNLCVLFNGSSADAGGDNCGLAKYDGRGFHRLPEPGFQAGGVGLTANTVYAARNGDLWLGSERGTACYHENKWISFVSTDKSTPEGATCFTELVDGTIWCATQSQIWEFDGRNWSISRTGFDRINGMLRSTRDGSVWVASNSGLLRFAQGAWVEYGLDEGLPSPVVRELFEDPRGQLWAATAHGLSLFHPEADPDPPRTSIQELNANRKSLPEGSTITLNFSGQDKWKYTPSERLLYSYRLDQHEWSPFLDVNHISLSDLPAGRHYFEVRAMDRNCNIDPKPAQFEFALVLPWYKETRLVLISAVGGCAALFFAGLAFNRHRRLLHSYAEVEKKVTERTQQLEVANRELLHSQKMTALGTLAAGIAHDFNNILSIIKGSAQIIEDNLHNPEKIRTRADRIRTVVDQGAGIVKAMLGFSRQTVEEPSWCDVNAVIEETLKLLGDRFLREVQVRFQPSAELPAVLASKEFIQQILLNLLFNAAESMPRNGQVVLTTRSLEKLPHELVLLPATAAVYVAISVQDCGCGISPQNLTRIFEPFFTTKAFSTRRGTGLGLSMVYELAKRLGSGLAVDSALDRGSTFTLFLPARECPPDNP